MSDDFIISVVIPAHNCGRFVAEAIDSVLAQTRPPEEIIVVDDGSTDDTRERVAPYVDRVRYIHQRNGGVASARNAGIRAARGSHIAFLDGDDRWLPHKLEKQLQALAANPGAQWVHADMLFWDDETGALTPSPPYGRERFVGSCYREFFWWCGVNTSTVVVSRRCLDEVGIFDEHIPGRWGEDLELWLRIVRKFPLIYVPEPLIHYRRHGTNATGNAPVSGIYESAYDVCGRELSGDPELRKSLGRAQVRDYIRSLALTTAYAY